MSNKIEKPKPTFSLKDQLFNRDKIDKIASAVQEVHPSFNTKEFTKSVVSEFPQLELKARITHIAICFKKYLPENYPHALQVLINSLPEPLDESLTDNDFGDFIYAPYGEFVALHGCTKEYYTISMNALKEMTKRFSVEYAIRYFINAFPDDTLKIMHEWCQDSNYHVRRLCSEGTRPNLPWGKAISYQSHHTLPILDQLYTDGTRFVTRSVANHLNDYTKKQPDLVLETLTEWQKTKKQEGKEMEFIIKHALRNLIKQGNNRALELVGIGDAKGVQINNLTHIDAVIVGQSLEFSFDLTVAKPKNIIIDYIIYFQNNKGTVGNKKIFKLKAFETTSSNETIKIQKSHPLRSMTTRQLYKGQHKVEIQVNGQILASFEFDLK